MSLRGGIELANANTVAFAVAMAGANGQHVARSLDLLVVLTGNEKVRVIVLSPSPGVDAQATIRRLVQEYGKGRTVVEDPFCCLDLAWSGLEARCMTIMVRSPGTERHRTVEDWAGRRPGGHVGPARRRRSDNGGRLPPAR